jgi:predicted deacetylase
MQRAQYLLRFEDICPTMDWSVWKQVEEILVQFKVKPLLAVIPDNQNENLRVRGPNKAFWDEVRGWQARGWTIGLHGYQHLYTTRDAGLMGINKFSEFSGLSYAEQTLKLQRALDIFERERVIADLWVAPGHSFDGTTLQALSDLGVRRLSDGFSLYPHLDSRGMMWIPQQLWRFRKMPFGVWTVCFHVNRWTGEDIALFRSELQRFVAVITDCSSVVATYRDRRSNAFDSIFFRMYQASVKGRKWLRERNSAAPPLLC